MHDEIAESIGTSKYQEILDRFEEPYLVEFAVQLQKSEEVRARAVENGKNDGTINSALEIEHIVHYLNLMITGKNS